ncbi:hypothetical protein FKL17_04390 [Escherichia coli]|nr:hypothetical protein [Escherichia coli]EFH7237076.1 hypothetical protein [Escherichia coli]EHB0512932.1 hypothetical protein [Escherichia coli]MBK2634110.1 hypothetical protein [Escherichia coli]HAM4769994.1 hypothetical protein [Escherichia coli]
MLPSETMIWQPEFTDKTLSRKPGAVHHYAQSLVHRILTHRLTWIVIAHKNQLSISAHAFDLFQNT